MTFLGIEIGNKTDWKYDLLLGMFLAGIFVTLSLFLPSAFAMGVPNMPLSSETENFLVTVGIAPVLEEIFFGGVILGVLVWLGVPFWLAIMAVAGVFSGFHYWAYTQGNYLAVSTPFVGAFVFRVLTSIVSKWRNSLLTGIIFHAGVNLSAVLSWVVVS